MGINQRERSLALVQRAMRFNPHHPGWYYVIPFLYHYYQEDYEAALDEAIGFNTPDYFWDPLARAADLGQLGRKKKAKNALGKLIDLVPNFDHRGRSLIKRMLFQDEYVKMLLDGLGKARWEIALGGVIV